MNILNVIQGSPEWLAVRANHPTASEAPAMLDLSEHMTRDDLVRQKATGEAKDIAPFTQRLRGRGHEAEERARAIAEGIIGEELYPATATREVDGLTLLASFDGITADDRKLWENKLWNAKSAAMVEAGVVPDTHWPQLEQQLLISGADAVLFTISDGTAEKTVSTWYSSDPARRTLLVAGWKQFAADLASYVVPEATRQPVAAPQETLPAVTVQVSGALAVVDNLAVFGDALTAYVARINHHPETDDDFATLERQTKDLRRAEDALTAAEDGALAQASSIDDMRRAVAHYREIARQARLMAEKVVKAEKENRKAAIINGGIADLAAYLLAFDFPMPMPVPVVQTDFRGAAKGLKTVASIQNAVNTELARAKIEAAGVAARITDNLTAIKDAGNAALFSDYPSLAVKDAEYVALEVARRIDAAKAADDARIAAERARIEAEVRATVEPEPKAAPDPQSATIAEPIDPPEPVRDRLVREFLRSRSVGPSERAKERAVIVLFLEFCDERGGV